MSYEDWLPRQPLGLVHTPDQSKDGFKSPLDGEWYWSAIVPQQIDFILGWDVSPSHLYFFGWVTPIPTRSWNFSHEGLILSYLGERPWRMVVWEHLKKRSREERVVKLSRNPEWYDPMNAFWVWRHWDKESIGSPETFCKDFRFWELGEEIHG